MAAADAQHPIFGDLSSCNVLEQTVVLKMPVMFGHLPRERQHAIHENVALWRRTVPPTTTVRTWEPPADVNDENESTRLFVEANAARGVVLALAYASFIPGDLRKHLQVRARWGALSLV